jgi:hypothetical protein
MATRREFLSSCAALACAGGAMSSAQSPAEAGEPSGVRVIPPSLAKVELMTKFTTSAFSRHLGSTFRMRGASLASPVAAELIDVTKQAVNASLEQFSILFRVNQADMLAQGTYSFEHAEMGEFDLFIVPVGRDDQGYCYEASFAYLRGA